MRVGGQVGTCICGLFYFGGVAYSQYLLPPYIRYQITRIAAGQIITRHIAAFANQLVKCIRIVDGNAGRLGTAL